MQTNPTTNRSTASSKCRGAATIRPGDTVRLYDAFYGQYHWHRVDEVITGARPQIKVDAYESYISTSLVSGHRKGAKRNG
jgi:hypothetical protein